jgi:FAD/FMN-containing dehydrogenase
VVEEIVAYNRTLYDRYGDLGGTNYPISAVRLTRDDWESHYGPHWGRLLRAKRRHDPDNVFASGPDIFGDDEGASSQINEERT